MAELKLVAPLLSNMEVVECVSTHGATSVYIVKSIRSNQTYILKHISVPESRKQVDALIFTGAASDEEQAQEYYKQVVTDYQSELETLETLSASPNLDCFRSYQIVPKEEGVGYDVYLLAEHRKTLVEHLRDNAMTRLSAIGLGLDLCAALSDLREAGLIHRNVKPSNIYLSSQGHFVLGDLGIAKISELKYCSIPEHILSSYSAPELFDLVGRIEPTCDLYSVGLILYRIYNGNHGPFEDEKTSAKAADKRRVTGEELPAPMYADYELADIILKACSFEPKKRYQTPEELRDALVDYTKRNQVDDTLIVPPIIGEHEPVSAFADLEEVEPVKFADAEELPEDFKQSFSPDTDMLNSIIASVHKEAERSGEDLTPASELEPDDDDIPFEPEAHRRKRKKAGFLPVFLIVLLLAAGIGAALYFFVIAPNSLTVNEIRLLDCGTNYLTVQADSPEKDGAFLLLCSDAYGNKKQLPYLAGQEQTFTDLVPGTQYTVTAEAPGKEKLNGNYTCMAMTVSQTEILSFIANPVSVTQCELNLIVLDGPEPDVWAVEYACSDTPAQTVTFSGHSTVVANLLSNTEYTFRLLEPEGTRLTGQTVTSFSTVPTVDITEIKAALSSTSAILSWSFEGDAPETWTVSVTGPDGYADTRVVSAPTVTIEDLTPGAEYEVLIQTPSMLDSYTTKIKPTVVTLTAFRAEHDDTNQCTRLSWECEIDPTDDSWIVDVHFTDQPGADPVMRLETDNSSELTVSDSDLLPGISYTATLATKSGEKLKGNNEVSFLTPASDKFTGYGLKDVYLGYYLRPEGENLSSATLSTPRTKFKAGESIAFALQTISEVSSGDEEVTVTMLLRDENNKLIDYEVENRVWSSMWNKDLFVGEFPRTPQRPGTYRMELLFNNHHVTSKEFEIEP